MKAIKMIAIISIQLILMANSCKEGGSYYDYKLKVINKSNMTIYAEYTMSPIDTLLPYTQSPFNHSPDKAAPNGTITLGRGGSWEDAFNKVVNQKLRIFIFNASIVDDTPWETVKKNYIILKRYDLSLHDLDSLNWTIKYP
jgi:hypothetical protein